MTPTLLAVLTPPGRAAIATIGVRGPRAVEIVAACFQPLSGRPLKVAGTLRVPFPMLDSSPAPDGTRSVPATLGGRIVVGRFRGLAGPGEELVVGLIGPDEIEVHCHGGIAAVAAVVAALEAHGATEIAWQEWIAGDQADTIAGEAHVALAAARTERTAAILLDQFRGALRAEVERIADLASEHLASEYSASGGREPPGNVRSRRASRLGEPGFRGAHAPRSPLGSPDSIERELSTLLARSDLGLHLTQPWQVVIAGPPNVGKSSLINALLGYERAIVFEEPGTTRDVLTASSAIEGWPVELADTAGLRQSGDDIEAAGIARAQSRIAQADLVLHVTDLSREWTEADERWRELILRLCGPEKVLLVHNKADLWSAATGRRFRSLGVPANGDIPNSQSGDESPHSTCSARTGEGIPELLAGIAALLVPDPPGPGAAVPFTVRQVQRLGEALAAWKRGDAQGAAATLRCL